MSQTAVDKAEAVIAAQRVRNAEFDRVAAEAAAKQKSRMDELEPLIYQMIMRSGKIGAATKNIYGPHARVLADIIDKKLNQTASIDGLYDIVASFTLELKSNAGFIAALESSGRMTGEEFYEFYLSKLSEVVRHNANPDGTEWTDFGEFNDDQLLAVQHGVLKFYELLYAMPELFIPKHLD